METKKSTFTGKAMRSTSLIAAMLLTAVSLSACIVAPERGYRGDGYRHHHWNNDGDWNGGGNNWQGNGSGWKRHH